jgi:hypothetical protein
LTLLVTFEVALAETVTLACVVALAIIDLFVELKAVALALVVLLASTYT